MSQVAPAIRMPNTKKPPGALVIREKVSMDSGMIRMAKSGPREGIRPPSPAIQVPEPRISRMEPMMVRVMVKPMPMPMPSRAESRMPFLEANISARPRMMQFTTIKGRYTPSALSKSGTYALTIICTTDTKPAITVM